MFQTYQSSYEEEGEMNNFQAFMSGCFFAPLSQEQILPKTSFGKALMVHTENSG